MKPYVYKRGFLTSNYVGDAMERMANTLGRGIEELEAIKADRTMTRAQITPALVNLQKTLDKSLFSQMDKVTREVEVQASNWERQAKEAIYANMSMTDAVLLAREMKSMNSSDRNTTIQFSKEFGRAAIIAPPVLSGLADNEVTKELFLRYHYPQLKEIQEQIERDQNALVSLNNHITEQVISISFNGDPSAIKTMYTPQLQRIDLDPKDTESIADYKQRTGTLPSELGEPGRNEKPQPSAELLKKPEPQPAATESGQE